MKKIIIYFLIVFEILISQAETISDNEHTANSKIVHKGILSKAIFEPSDKIDNKWIFVQSNINESLIMETNLEIFGFSKCPISIKESNDVTYCLNETHYRASSTFSYQVNESRLVYPLEIDFYHVGESININNQQQASNLFKDEYLTAFFTNKVVNYDIQMEKRVLTFNNFSDEILWFSINSQINNEIEVKLSTSNIDCNSCPLFIMIDDYHDCLSVPYKMISNLNFKLRVNRTALHYNTKLEFRRVISGCNNQSIRNIDLSDSMPNIVHNSPNKCIYNISIPDHLMISVNLKNMRPSDSSCNSSMRLLGKMDENRNPTNSAVASFCNSISNFGMVENVLIRNSYAVIDVYNSLYEFIPIEINIKGVNECGATFELTDTSFILSSLGLMSPKRDNFCSWSFVSPNLDSVLKVKLLEYESLNDNLESSLVISDLVKETDKMNIKLLTRTDLNNPSVIGNNEITIQFSRMPTSVASHFKLSISTISQKKFSFTYTEPSGYVTSINYPLYYPENTKVEYQIQVEDGYRIILYIENLNIGVCADETCLECEDEIIIDLDKRESNPKLCGRITKEKRFYSYTNKMLIKFRSGRNLFSTNNNDSTTIMGFKFRYESIPLCGHIHTSPDSVLPYYNLNSFSNNQDTKVLCKNTIFSPNMDDRILMYPIYWTSVNNSVNCNSSLTIVKVADEYMKEGDSMHNQNEIISYSNCDSVKAMISKHNTYTIITNINNANYYNVSYDIGYAVYKQRYTKLQDEFTVDFSKSIVENVMNVDINKMIFKIEVPSEYYIVPTIFNCATNLSTGSVFIRTPNEYYQLILTCGNQNFTVLSPMTNELIIEILDSNMIELRDNLKLSIKYRSLPKIFHDLSGSFESFNMQDSNILTSKSKIINYKWIIELGTIYYIKLNIHNIINCNDTIEFNIRDSRNSIIYDKLELCENFLQQKNVYNFATNKIIVTFNYIRPILTNTQNLPYLNCSYTSDIRIIKDKNGDIMLSNNNSQSNKNWLILAPIGNIIIVNVMQPKLNDINGQLKFSYLGNGYSDEGVYYYDFKNLKTSDQYDRNTDVVVSNTNKLRIEYISNKLDEVVELKYSMESNIFTEPSGIIRQYSSLNNPSIFVPKLTDQKWIIRAPYKKKIELNILDIDLPLEHPCSKAKLDIIESNGEISKTFCGIIQNEYFRSKSNILEISFKTHNNKEVVYEMDENGNKNLYTGFRISYNFIEETGDCYFQKPSNELCGYDNIGNLKWNIVKQGFIEIKSGISQKRIGKLLSPLLEPSKSSLQFSYKLKGGRLMVNVMAVNQPGVYISLPIEITETNEWVSVRTNIFQRVPFRLIFDFISPENSFITGYAALDDIILLETSQVLSDSDNSNMNEFIPFINDKFCLKSFDYCSQNPCLNNGTCINSNTDTSYTCVCKQGYTGKNCENIIDWCKIGHKCSAKSKCLSDINNYSCSCNDGYFGLYCENKYDLCRTSVNPCNYLTQQGDCINEQSNIGYHCSCDPLYTGKECETKLNKTCLLNNCNKYDSKAKCLDTDNDIYCECSTGYSGRFCEKINYCENINCQNGGTCINLVDSFYCKCETDYKGNFCEISKTCEKCSNKTVYCDKEANSCVCINGFTGRFCETQIKHCESNSCIHGKCEEILTDYSCVCDAGYSGKSCNESETICSANPCYNGGSCFLSDTTNRSDTFKAENSSFYCFCEKGFTGQLCETLIDYCESSPCKNGAKCHNELNGYSCECIHDYLGPLCDMKADNCNHSKCASGSTCVSTVGDFKCYCEEGKDGRYCNNVVNYCLNNDCMNGQCYSAQHGELYCQCSPGYGGNSCEEELDECKSDPCVNGGSCYDLLDQYYCACPPEYTGKQCEHKVNFCSLDQCNSNNTVQCINYNGGLKCVCKSGFTGRFCEVAVSKCDILNPCHSGTCLTDKDSYKCVDCLPGYEGKDCNDFIDFCSEKSCQHNETCFSKLNSHYCLCSGDNCGHHNDKCELNKCKNNATCQINSNTNDGYKCVCQQGYEGNYCEFKIDPCANVTCEYGYCYNGKCICDPKLPYCKKSDCEKMDCLNGGKCIDVFLLNNITKSICICPPGMTGALCEKSIYCTKDLCGSNNCKTVDESFECKCNQSQVIGSFCDKKLDDQLRTYESLLRSERQKRTMVECRFGYSKLSKIFITIVSVCILCFSIIAFLIGHCVILSFKKTHKIESRAKPSIFEGFSKNVSRTNNTNNNNNNNNNTKSNVVYPNEFIIPIPRPQIRDNKKSQL